MRSDFPTMASMVEVLATIRLPQLLGPATLAQLQGAAADLRSTLGSDQVWRQCIMADQPCLILRALLFESSARHALMHCYGHLCRSTIGIGDEPLLQNAEEARRLGKLLHRMEKARGAHLKEGGRVAGILVGRLRLSPRQDTHGDKSDKALGSRHVFRLPPELNEYFGGCGELVVRLGSGQDLRVRLSQTPVQKRGDLHQNLVLDVCAASSGLVLDYRTCPVNLDRHCCHADFGMHSFPHDSMACGKDPSPDILCAFFIRDGWPPVRKTNLGLTLNLDTPLIRQ